MKKDGLTPSEWLFITEPSLRALDKDAKAKDIAEASLKELQLKLDDLTKLFNDSSKANWSKDNQVYDLQKRNFELENPPWYKSSSFWGLTGFAFGVVATVVGGVVIGYYVK